MDLDGAFEYSKIIMLTSKRDVKAKVRTYPNPVQEQLVIEGFTGILTVYNLLGQPIRAFQVVNEFETLSLYDLDAGHYLLEMRGNDGVISTQKIIKEN